MNDPQRPAQHPAPQSWPTTSWTQPPATPPGPPPWWQGPTAPQGPPTMVQQPWPSTPPSTPPAPPPGPPPAQAGDPRQPPRRRRALSALVAAAVVVAAAAGGAGIGHLVWPGTQTAAGSPIEMSAGPAGSDGSTGGSSGDAAPNGAGTGSSATGSGPAGSGTEGSGGSGTNGESGSDGGGTGAWPPDLLPNGLVPGGLLPGGSTWPGLDSTGSGTITSAPGAPDDISGILDKVDDAVVDINVTFGYQQAAGAGTGIVLSSTGEVLTNNHVIDGATSISATDVDTGKTYQASVVGYDKSRDIALLQLKHATGLETATIGDSDSLSIGDAVVGIGNAGGVGGTPSAAGGSVTAVNRTITVGDELYGTTATLSGLIQVNANIQSGDSGGPLVTASGAVVGVNTAAAAGTAAGSDRGEGYAIPIDDALSVVQVIRSGTGTKTVHVGPTAALGVLISTADRPSTGQPGTATDSPTRGALVAGVLNGGAAAKAGLQRGDVITSLGGHRVSSAKELSTLMIGYRPGQSVALGWTDASGQTHTETVTLGTGPAA